MKITKNNIRKKILVEKYLANPTYYENRRVILDELIKKRKDGLITVEEIFEQYADLVKKLESPDL